MAARESIIVALDFPSAAAALSLVDSLGELVLWYKVGLQLYLAEGPKVMGELLSRGKLIFLDLKLHDIPNTVSGAVGALRGSGCRLLTVHASGGPAMLNAAATAGSSPGSPQLLAVTVLTSMEEAELDAVGINARPSKQVERLASLAVAAGIPGLVCSPQEVAALRQAFGPELLLVVPGIRPGGPTFDDQRRTASAAEAIRAGASMLVVGRPVTLAADPRSAVLALLREMDEAAS